MEAAGMDMTKDKKDIVLIFGKESIQGREDGKLQPDNMGVTYRIDKSTNPIQIDLIPKMGGGGPAVLQGILKLEGDKLTMCFGMPVPDAKEPRPTNFVPDPGKMTMMMHLKRVK
jgi:uncharacterized protein (TIGR03067 family)